MCQHNAGLYQISFMENPLLSVCIICYNQADYISQAIENVLNQKINFTHEIIIADDCSSDGTREIVLAYQAKYPGTIKVLPNQNNLGPAKNFERLFYAANGKYVAYVEGDDYWTDSNKLQMQVDFLEQHADFAICFTDALETFSENLDDELNYRSAGSGQQSETTANELIFRNYIQTCTVVFKNKLFGKFPDWYATLIMGDWPLHLLNAAHGKIKYLDTVTAVHRNHSSGVWSSQKILGRIYNTIEAYNVLEKNTDFKNLDNFKKSKSNVYLSSVKYHIKEKAFFIAFKNLIKGFILYPKHLINRKNPV